MESWKTLIHSRLTGGSFDLIMYEVYVSGKLLDGPVTMETDEDNECCVSSNGRSKATNSCCPEFVRMNRIRPVSGVLRLKNGDKTDVPHGATSVRTGMFIFAYQCCWKQA